MKISVFSPVKNEVDFIGYSVMAVLPYVHEILYGIAPSDDGTEELLEHIERKYAKGKLKLFWGHANHEPIWDFKADDMVTYNKTYNYLMDKATGDAVWFLHPDMIVTNPEQIEKVKEGPLAWWTNIDSYAGDLQTRILSGRAPRWKNIHAKKLGLHYFGAYGSQNEDMYFSEITGNAYKHYGESFDEYPFEIGDSGINVNHYCELKSYSRRLEKMIRCLKTQHPGMDDKRVHEIAIQHPRVTLDPAPSPFGTFAFEPAREAVPAIFAQYHDEFSQFVKVPKKQEALTHGK